MKTPAHFSFDVFLSHNSKDNAQVRRLAERLRAAGMRVWFDEWIIKPGDDIYLAIERGLEAARSLVLCLSPAALGSDWVGLERSTALFRDPSNVGRRFIPILLADCTLPDTLRRYKYVDFRQEADAAFKELLNACGVTTEGFQTLPEDAAILPQPVDEEHLPTAVQSLLEEGRKLVDEGCYPEARRKIESAKQAGETANNAAAVLESRIQIAQIAIREQRDVAAARDHLLDCLHNLSADAQAKKREKVLGLLGDAEILRGSVEEAMSLYREARQLAQKRNDRFAEAPYLIGLSHAEELLGNLKEAHSLLNEATGLYRAEYRDATGEEKRRTAINLGATYSTKAKLLRHEGKVTDAIICLARAQPLFREANSRDNLGRVLVFKAEILLNEASREDGFEALKEALSTFESIGNVGWQCRCLDDMAHFSFKSGDDAAALACLTRALHLVGSERPQIEAVPYLLKSAHLCRDHDQAEKAKVFVERAKEIAATAGDDGLMAKCLVAEASTLDGTAARAARENLFRCAVKHLDSALTKCEVKGRRAEYMLQIGDLYGWLRDIHEARGWFEQALREYEEIGDVRGLGACLASLAAAAREEKSPAEAIAMLEHLIAFSEGKPLHYDRAGALHDLGMLKLSQGDVGGANRCLEAAKALAEKHGFRDVLAALKVSLERLADAERFYQPPQRDLPSLIQELHEWCRRYSEFSKAILPLWYFFHRVELWGICRSLLGVKFLVCGVGSALFRRTADVLCAQGDICAWGINFAFTTKPQTELIPFPMDFFVPPHLKTALLKEKPSNPADATTALKSALRDESYVLVPCDDTVNEKHGTYLFILGRHIRLAPMITKMMLDTPAKDLVASKRICLPLGERNDPLDFVHIMLVAWQNGMIPVLLERLPHHKETQSSM